MHPSEALEIARWRETAAGQAGDGQHIRRLACCAALIYAAGHEVMADCSEIETVGALVESAIALGAEHVDGAARLVAWRLELSTRLGVGGFDLYCGMALLALGVAAEREAGVLLGVLDWIEHQPLRLETNQRAALWEALVAAAAERAEPALAARLRAILPLNRLATS